MSSDFLIHEDNYTTPDGTTIGIRSLCYESYPCAHSVSINGQYSLMSGRDIKQLFVQHGMEVPQHFSYY